MGAGLIHTSHGLINCHLDEMALQSFSHLLSTYLGNKTVVVMHELPWARK
jgi:hypothetical protein